MGNARTGSARAKLRAFFLANLSRTIETAELQAVAGISDYQRRIRELRRDEGFQILSHHDRDDLKPGQYRLDDPTPIAVTARGVSGRVRAEVLRRDGFTCQACGAGAGEPDEMDPKRAVRLHVDHIVPVSEGGSNEVSNLRALCGQCNEGRSNLDLPPSEQTLNVLETVRRSPRDVQLRVHEFLSRKFGPLSP